MLSNIVVATAVLASAPLAHAVGSAVVKNGCNYNVKLSNVPSANGGYQTIDQSLAPGATYSQQYTELTNGNGWSIKLSPDETLDHIVQYEYTYHNDGIIWYDLSEVDGNPWNGNWEITAEGSNCSPRQAAYRYSTDDAYGMQSCSDDSTITVLLCSGESQNDGSASSLSSAAAAPSTSSVYVAPSTSVAAPIASTTSIAAVIPVIPVVSAPATTSVDEDTPWHSRAHKNAVATTLATVASTTGNVVVVTEIVTEIATATAFAKRHVHHAAHPHARA